MNWLKNLFKKKHKHTPVWYSRQVVEETSLDFTGSSVIVDIQPATRYLYKGHCFECGENIRTLKTIAKIFDTPQPYDAVINLRCIECDILITSGVYCDEHKDDS